MQFYWNRIRFLMLGICCLVLGVAVVQTHLVHGQHAFVPQETRLDLRPLLAKPVLSSEDCRALFRQTGLGPAAVAELRAKGPSGNAAILDYQDAVFSPGEIDCQPLVGGITREDQRLDASAPPFASLRPGDILVTLSTHSFGWKHGHAALVLDSDTALESLTLGTASVVTQTADWLRYSNYAVLRVKDLSAAVARAVAAAAFADLQDLPYRLHAGLLGDKVRPGGVTAVQCAYLVWYAWQRFGVDLDGNGGRLVTPRDFLRSDKLEVVQVFGLDLGSDPSA